MLRLKIKPSPLVLETEAISKTFSSKGNVEVSYVVDTKGIRKIKTKSQYDENAEINTNLLQEEIISPSCVLNVNRVIYERSDTPFLEINFLHNAKTFSLQGNLKSLASRMPNIVPVTTNENLTPFISSLVDSAERKKIISSVSVGLPEGNGIYLDKVTDKIEEYGYKKEVDYVNSRGTFVKTEEGVTSLADDLREDAIQGLRDLKSILDFYFESEEEKKFSNTIIALGIYSGLSWVRKKSGKFTPIIIIEGPSNTGKTALASIVLYMYGINKNNTMWSKCFGPGSDFRASSMDILSKTTLPFFLDEAQELLNKITGKRADQDSIALAENMKIASDGHAYVPMRKVMTDTSSRDYKELFCTRSIFMISNYSNVSFSGDAWKKRILMFETNQTQKKSNDKSSEIGTLLTDKHNIESLKWIGNYVLDNYFLGDKFGVDRYLGSSFYESACMLWNDIQKELGVNICSQYQMPKEINDDYEEIILTDIKRFILSSLNYQFKDEAELNYDSNGLGKYQAKLLNQINAAGDKHNIPWLVYLKNKNQICILKNDFVHYFDQFAIKTGKNTLESGIFEKLLGGLGEINSKISYRFNGKIKNKSGVKINVMKFIDWLLGQDVVFDDYSDEDLLNFLELPKSMEEIKTKFGDVEKKIKKLNEVGDIFNVAGDKYKRL